MRKVYLAYLAVVLPLLVCGTVIPGAFMIEYANDFNYDHPHILAALSPLGPLLKVHQTYSSDLFHGVSVRLSEPVTNTPPSQTTNPLHLLNHPLLSQLFASPSVRAIYPINYIPRPQWDDSESTHNGSSNGIANLPFGNLSQTRMVHERLNITGKGITIGILDTGVDYNHPALGGGFGEGYKIRLGYNLVNPDEDDQDIGTHRNAGDPFDPCPGDDAGHGTHVTGIIGAVNASMNYVGVAPEATLGMWRIFGCSGGAEEDVVVKAMEMAYAAGCDVINLSLGVQTAWPENAMAVVADRLSKKGVTVVSVAGNQGSDGIFLQNSPGSGRSVVSVASVDNAVDRTKILTVNVLPNQVFGYEWSTSTKQFPSNGTLVVAFDDNQVMTACKNDPPKMDISDKIILVRRGGCTFDEKSQTAQAAGALAIIVYDPQLTNGSPFYAQTTNSSKIPCATITYDLAEKLVALSNANRDKIVLNFSNDMVGLKVKSGGQVSGLSSAGPTYELDLKPNLAGIGSQVYSTLPLHIGDGWGMKSGTSMAAPHVTGTLALLLQWQKERQQQETARGNEYLLEMLQNHARLASFEDQPDHPLLQGAGLAQPFDALQSTVHVSPGQLSFNDTANLIRTQTLKVTNRGPQAATYQLQHMPSKSISSFANASSFVPTEPVLRGDVQIQLHFEPRQVTLEPGQSTTIAVTALLPEGMDYHYPMYGGFIALDNGQGATVASVPYFGVLGSLRDLPLFDQGFPYLAPSDNANIVYGTNDTFTFNRTDNAPQPMLVSRLLTATAHVNMRIMQEGRDLGALDGSPFLYWERNRLHEPNYYRTTPWNGKVLTDQSTEAMPVEPGRYQIQVHALKLLGDPSNPRHWETWISGPILVQ